MGGFHGPEQSHKLLDALEEKAEGASSENEEQAIRQQMAALDRFFNKGKIDAKFKIELQFGKDRSSWKPFAGAMSLFLSGTKLHGGGDEKLYFCPREDCDGVVFPNDRIGSSVVCRNCQMQWDEESLVGERLYRLTSQNWAEVVTKWFRKVELNADIYLKYHPMDIRSKAAVEPSSGASFGSAVAFLSRSGTSFGMVRHRQILGCDHFLQLVRRGFCLEAPRNVSATHRHACDCMPGWA